MISEQDYSEEEKFEMFEMIFYDELDSWFSADIMCCTNCVDDFIGVWPGIYNRELEFQKSGIQLSTFYKGSLLCESFSVDDFKRFSRRITCPRCGDPLYDFFWPYCYPYGDLEGFEQTLEEIQELANQHPFLLLSNAVAGDLHRQINEEANRAQSAFLKQPLFRGRIFEKNYNYTAKDFLAPDRSKVKEGRYNHAGKPVLYLAEERQTCFYEMRSPEEGIILAEVRINRPLKTLDLLDDDVIDENLLGMVRWSSLMFSPSEGEGSFKPHYVFTRFVADCASHAGFDAIRYPSVRGDGTNLVLLRYNLCLDDITIGDQSVFYKSDIKPKAIF